MFINRGLTTGVATLQPFGIYPWQTHVLPGDGLCPMPRVHWVAALPTASSRVETNTSHSAVPSHSRNMVRHTALKAWKSHLIPLPSLHGKNGSSSPGGASPDYLVNSKSVVGLNLLILVWSSGWWIYSHLVGRKFHCLITHLSWFHGQGVNINWHPTWTRLWGLFCFWTRQWRTLSMVLTQSSQTPLTHQNWMHSLMGLMPYHLQSLQAFCTLLILFLILLDCS